MRLATELRVRRGEHKRRRGRPRQDVVVGGKTGKGSGRVEVVVIVAAAAAAAVAAAGVVLKEEEVRDVGWSFC